MATFNQNCDVYQGFNFKKDKVTPVGFITKLKIGSVELKPDFAVKDPENYTDDLQVVCVLDGLMWELGVTDAIYMSGQVSVTNQQNIKLLTYSDLTNVECLANIALYAYDQIEKKYYKSLLPTDDAELKCLLEKESGDLTLSIADDASSEIQSPENFSFQIGLKPQKVAQTITISTSATSKIVKQFGLTEK